MDFEEWVADLRTKPWYTTPTPEAEGEKRITYFDVPDDSTLFDSPGDAVGHEAGSFLVEQEYETYEVFPGLSYQINDSLMNTINDGGKFDIKAPWWWEDTAVSVPRLALGKWQSLHGFCEPVLPNPALGEPQEIWVSINGGWMWTPDDDDDDPSFRSHLAKSMQVSDWALWKVACRLTSRNLGLAIVPAAGKLITYELSCLEVALASPSEVVEGFTPCENLKRIGVGRYSNSGMVSGTGGSTEMTAAEYQRILNSINRPFTSASELLEALRSCTESFEAKVTRPRFLGKKPRKSRRDEADIETYLSGRGEGHFAKLAAAGYAVALIPLGGKTIWVPPKF